MHTREAIIEQTGHSPNMSSVPTGTRTTTTRSGTRQTRVGLLVLLGLAAAVAFVVAMCLSWLPSAPHHLDHGCGHLSRFVQSDGCQRFRSLGATGGSRSLPSAARIQVQVWRRWRSCSAGCFLARAFARRGNSIGSDFRDGCLSHGRRTCRRHGTEKS